jgi:hypothetical protein
MRPFRYLRDPLFLMCCAAYALNRWLLKPHFHSAFLHSHFNDLLLIPCALPPVLLLQRWCKLRSHDEPPRPGEILFQLLIWSALFEWLGPQLLPHVTGDLGDVLAYACGGLLAGLWWHRAKWLRTPIAT